MIEQIKALKHNDRIKIKLRADGYLYPATCWRYNNRLIMQFDFNRTLLNAVKAMDGAKWHGHANNPPPPVGKWWSIALNQRNFFQLEYLLGGNPYAQYDLPLVDIEIPARTLRDGRVIVPYDHQADAVRHILTRRHCLLGYEMGTGKTLAAIIALELFEQQFGKFSSDDLYFIAPRSALKAVEIEFWKWNTHLKPIFLTYEGNKKLMDNWPDGKKAPRAVCFDEFSRLKNPTSQRSQAARALADGIRSDWGFDSLIFGMSGSPAPKSPVDWWAPCEIACPGFLREGNTRAFERRLALVVNKTKLDGGTYPERVAWLDDEKKCATCGKPKEALEHGLMHHDAHDYKPSVNEVALLYKRMKGLVDIRFKKDCLSLPEKRYIETVAPATIETLRLARIIQKRATSAIQCLTLLRELSDGFQYVEEECGTAPCDACKDGKQLEYYDPEDPDAMVDPYDLSVLAGDNPLVPTLDENGEEVYITDEGTIPVSSFSSWMDKRAQSLHDRLKTREISCFKCGGSKVVPVYKREAQEIACPKDAVILDNLELLDDIGRYVIYAGFFGSVNRCVRLCREAGWHTIRADGRGWLFSDPEGNVIKENPLVAFQDYQDRYSRIAFIGQPDAAGMGITLTASPKTTYFSNTFNAEGRIQSEDRIHRAGMDYNRGATIEDIIHLPSDQLVLDNLRKKRKLQALTMGEIMTQLDAIKLEPGVRENAWTSA